VIALRILGVPAPQGSKTAVVVNGSARLLEGGSKTGRAKHRAWRHAVAAEAEEHALRHGAAPDGPLVVRILFVMPKPKSRPKRARWCDRKPDLDKLVRSTLDGLADGGVLAHGDSRVASITVGKVYAVPGQGTGAHVTVRPLDEREADLLVDVFVPDDQREATSG
jgi:Holliday junction resolvase RusA-like endonuclease